MPEPGDLIAAANKQICEDTRYEKIVEIFPTVIDLEFRSASYIGAGHSGVLLKKNGDVVTLGGMGLPAGMTDDLMMDETGHFQMEQADLLAIYTDGLYECRNGSNKMLGQSTILSLLQNSLKANLHDLIDSLIEVSCNFCEPQAPSDDITIVLVRCTV